MYWALLGHNNWYKQGVWLCFGLGWVTLQKHSHLTDCHSKVSNKVAVVYTILTKWREEIWCRDQECLDSCHRCRGGWARSRWTRPEWWNGGGLCCHWNGTSISCQYLVGTWVPKGWIFNCLGQWSLECPYTFLTSISMNMWDIITNNYN